MKHSLHNQSSLNDEWAFQWWARLSFSNHTKLLRTSLSSPVFTWLIKHINLQTTGPSLSSMSTKMICMLQVLASVCIFLIEEYALTFYAHILGRIIVSINCLRPHSTGGPTFIISWQFAGWQGVGERTKKMQTQNSQSGNRNLTVSQGNLSFCQTSLMAAAQLSRSCTD